MMFSQHPIENGASRLMQRVYAWMLAALSISGLTAFGVAHYPAAQAVLLGSPMIVFLLIIAQLGLVFFLSLRLQHMDYQTAIASFLLYALLSGVTLSSVFLVYTMESIALTFFICAAMFGAMALYGYFTKADLSSLGSVLLMGIFGLIICLLINMFLRSTQFDFIISIFGVIIFTLLTAYDVQQIKRLGDHMIDSGDALGKVAIIGALKLYLDFVNLFLYLLRFFGQQQRRN